MSPTMDKGGRKRAVVINSSLVMLTNRRVEENNLEICKLEVTPPGPRLQTICFLELPPLITGVSLYFSDAYTEWVPSSTTYAQSRSSRGCHLPFYSPTVCTIALRLEFLLGKDIRSFYTMVINVAALLDAICTDGRTVPWAD
jgi:hypothetical protein